jgi:hypothetical protein
MASRLSPIDLSPFLSDPDSREALATCQHLADVLVSTSALVVRDPRAPAAANDRFLNLLERYFAQPADKIRGDVRAEVHYQVRAVVCHFVLFRVLAFAACAARKAYAS